jgi:malonate transporter
MLAILNVIAPVFALLAVGYLAVRFKLFPASGVDALVAFVNNFATPCLLFEAMLTADFKTAYNPAIIAPFYVGALTSMFVGMFLAVRLFRNTKPEGVVSGFSAMFTNTVLVGIPIIQRAYGAPAMPVVYSIITFHSTLLITGGMLIMELARREGASLSKTLVMAALRVFKNPLLWGIGLGIVGNLVGLKLIEPAQAFVSMMSAAVLPAALFGLGGALNEYRLSENWVQSLVMSLFKLIVQPLIAWVLIVPVLHVDPAIARYGVLLAAMPSGINAYVFATYYNRNINVAANTVLLSTVLAVLTISFWLSFLG